MLRTGYEAHPLPLRVQRLSGQAAEAVGSHRTCSLGAHWPPPTCSQMQPAPPAPHIAPSKANMKESTRCFASPGVVEEALSVVSGDSGGLSRPKMSQCEQESGSSCFVVVAAAAASSAPGVDVSCFCYSSYSYCFCSCCC